MHKIIGNDESIYLIRQVIKKYSRNNILNALFEFICEKENDDPPIDQDKNNTTNDTSINKNQNIENEEEPKKNIKKFNTIKKRIKKGKK